MSILVTGAAGFIGCNNVLALNELGITDIIAVDNLERGEKYQNLAVQHLRLLRQARLHRPRA